MLLSANDVLNQGLKFMGVRCGRKSQKTLNLDFHSHYGSSPLVLAEQWNDLCQWKHKDFTSVLYATCAWNNRGRMPTKDKSERGFKHFMAAHFWLWTRPKNAHVMASRFGMCADHMQGKHLWKWIGRTASLEAEKIKWDESLDAEDTEVFAITNDGVDFPIWERQHPDFPMDRTNMSHKFKGCAAKYIIALSTFRAKCVHIAGPYKGSKPDLEIFKECGLMDRLKLTGKKCIVDRGYKSKVAEEREVFAYPDYIDSKELHNFKSRARLRQETFNRRLKHFGCLERTFTNGFDKHGIALRAVAVTVQYQMDLGSPIYAV